MSKIDEFVQDLAMARAELSKAKASLKEMKRRFEASPKWKLWSGLKNAFAIDEKKADTALREHAVLFGKGHPHNAVEVQEWTAMHYDKAKAIEWCLENFREAIELNTKLFEEHAKGVRKTAPIPLVQFGKELKVKISSSLNAYLPEDIDD